jgi:hypothetical protein
MGSISEYFYEIGSRDVDVITPEVIEFETTLKTQIKNFPRSGIWIIISQPLSKIISELREAISKKDYDRFDFLVNPGSKAFVKAIENKIENKTKLFNSIRDIPVIAEVTYGPKLLARCLYILPELDYMFTLVPYYGGNLSTKDFRISQYFKKGYVEHLDVVIVIKRPILTDLEKIIFQKIPEEISQADLKVVNDFTFPSIGVKLVDVKDIEAKKDKIKEQYVQLEDQTLQNTFVVQEQQQLNPQEIILQEQIQDTGKQQQNGVNQRIEEANIIELFDNLDVEYSEKLDVHSSATRLLTLREILVRKNLIQ